MYCGSSGRPGGGCSSASGSSHKTIPRTREASGAPETVDAISVVVMQKNSPSATDPWALVERRTAKTKRLT